jgi:hypothetical protein
MAASATNEARSAAIGARKSGPVVFVSIVRDVLGPREGQFINLPLYGDRWHRGNDVHFAPYDPRQPTANSTGTRQSRICRDGLTCRLLGVCRFGCRPARFCGHRFLDLLNNELMKWRSSRRNDIETCTAHRASEFNVAKLDRVRMKPFGATRTGDLPPFAVWDAQVPTANMARYYCHLATPRRHRDGWQKDTY